jgi:hypothetical protein
MRREGRWMRGGKPLDAPAPAAHWGAPVHRFPHLIHVSDPAATLGRRGLHPRFHRAHHYWRDTKTEQQEP